MAGVRPLFLVGPLVWDLSAASAGLVEGHEGSFGGRRLTLNLCRRIRGQVTALVIQTTTQPELIMYS
jgi:hypothetical protein